MSANLLLKFFHQAGPFWISDNNGNKVQVYLHVPKIVEDTPVQHVFWDDEDLEGIHLPGRPNISIPKCDVVGVGIVDIKEEDFDVESSS